MGGRAGNTKQNFPNNLSTANFATMMIVIPYNAMPKEKPIPMRSLIRISALLLTGTLIFLIWPPPSHAQSTAPAEGTRLHLDFAAEAFTPCTEALYPFYPDVSAIAFALGNFGEPLIATSGQASGGGAECVFYGGVGLEMRFVRPVIALSFNRSGAFRLEAFAENVQVLQDQTSGLGGRVEYRFGSGIERLRLIEDGGSGGSFAALDDLELQFANAGIAAWMPFTPSEAAVDYMSDCGDFMNVGLRTSAVLIEGIGQIEPNRGCVLQPGALLDIRTPAPAFNLRLDVDGALQVQALALDGTRLAERRLAVASDLQPYYWLDIPASSTWFSVRNNSDAAVSIAEVAMVWQIPREHMGTIDFSGVATGEACAVPRDDARISSASQANSTTRSETPPGTRSPACQITADGFYRLEFAEGPRAFSVVATATLIIDTGDVYFSLTLNGRRYTRASVMGFLALEFRGNGVLIDDIRLYFGNEVAGR